MSEDEPWLGRRPSPHHMLIASANIGTYDFENDAVITPLAARVNQFRKINAAHFHLARPDVNDSAIATDVRLSS
jgi:hypothetical protein